MEILLDMNNSIDDCSWQLANWKYNKKMIEILKSSKEKILKKMKTKICLSSIPKLPTNLHQEAKSFKVGKGERFSPKQIEDG